MKRFDVLAILTMFVMAVAWMPGCGRDDQISRTGTIDAPAPPDETAEAAAVEDSSTASEPAEYAGTPDEPVESPPTQTESATPQVPPPSPSQPPASPAPTVPEPTGQSAPSSSAEAAKPAPAPPQPQPAASPAAEEGTAVVGRISVVSRVPQPAEVPYRDCLTMIKYTVESVASGSYEGDELLAAFWGMRDAELQPAAKFQVGQRHRLVIEPLAEHADLLRAMQADDTNEYSLAPQWVVKYSAP